MTDQLDAFQTRLLTELNAVAHEHARSQRVRRRGLTAAAAAVTALAVGGGVLAFQAVQATPAYAVTTNSDGLVIVTVNRPEGAKGLQDALAKVGVRANVTFNASGMQCQVDRGKAIDVPMPPWTYRDAGGSAKIWVPAHLLASDQTLVIDSSWPSGASWALGLSVIQGPVAACVPIATDSVVPPATVPQVSVPGGSTQFEVPCPPYPSTLPGVSDLKCYKVEVDGPSATPSP